MKALFDELFAKGLFVEGKTVYSKSHTGTIRPLVVCDFISAEYVMKALKRSATADAAQGREPSDEEIKEAVRRHWNYARGDQWEPTIEEIRSLFRAPCECGGRIVRSITGRPQCASCGKRA